MPTFKTILCPIDFSNESDHALAHATAIARWSSARLVGLHVFTPVFAPIPEFAMGDYVGEALSNDEAVEGLERDVTKALAPSALAGLKTEAHCVTGDPAREIVAWSRSLPADLIVIGTHGAGGFERLMLGSVAEKVLRKAECPVMTVPPRSGATSVLPYKRVLCPVDFAEPSTHALEYAVALASDAGAVLTVIVVLEWPTDMEPRSNRSFNVPEYSRYREAAAKEELDALLARPRASHCNVHVVMAHGKPYVEILRTATAEPTDVIVMGVHGRNPIDLMLFGSTTNQVVRRATCPVLTVRR